MIFVDEALIRVKAGDGGDGSVAFRREKFVPRGGPAGGSGGKGGDIILMADPSVRTLVDHHLQGTYTAESGQKGRGKNQHGRDGKDLIIKVPPGTVAYDGRTGKLLADLVRPGQWIRIARGGRGGRGNASFATPVRQTPVFAEKGEPGEERILRLELKLLADVGLIGFPNVGKSTLISRISAAKPKIADYPFTTLIPNLGTVKVDNFSFVVADLPGLIEGAHKGAGLGHQFLRHAERTRLLVHLLDMDPNNGRDPLEDRQKINRELELFSQKLSRTPQLIAANKVDLPGADRKLNRCLPALRSQSLEVYPISALTGLGLTELVLAIARFLREAMKEVETGVPEQLPEPEREEAPLTVTPVGDGAWKVEGGGVERLAALQNANHPQAKQEIRARLERRGVLKSLRALGARPGCCVIVGDVEVILDRL